MAVCIGIIRDGHSDFLILKQFLSAVFERYRNIKLSEDNFYNFEDLNITNELTKFIDKSAKADEYSFSSAHNIDFRNDLNNLLFTAYQKLLKENGTLCNNDLLILNADAEKILGEKKLYFEQWAYSIGNAIWFSVEHFYNKMIEQGYSNEQLPLILPIVLFPSSEILLASCMFSEKHDFRAWEAKPTLKQKVYETESVGEVIRNGEIYNILETWLTAEHISNIYKEIPEARKLIQILSFAS